MGGSDDENDTSPNGGRRAPRRQSTHSYDADQVWAAATDLDWGSIDGDDDDENRSELDVDNDDNSEAGEQQQLHPNQQPTADELLAHPTYGVGLSRSLAENLAVISVNEENGPSYKSIGENENFVGGMIQPNEGSVVDAFEEKRRLSGSAHGSQSFLLSDIDIEVEDISDEEEEDEEESIDSLDIDAEKDKWYEEQMRKSQHSESLSKEERGGGLSRRNSRGSTSLKSRQSLLSKQQSKGSVSIQSQRSKRSHMSKRNSKGNLSIQSQNTRQSIRSQLEKRDSRGNLSMHSQSRHSRDGGGGGVPLVRRSSRGNLSIHSQSRKSRDGSMSVTRRESRGNLSIHSQSRQSRDGTQYSQSIYSRSAANQDGGEGVSPSRYGRSTSAASRHSRHSRDGSSSFRSSSQNDHRRGSYPPSSSRKSSRSLNSTYSRRASADNIPAAYYQEQDGGDRPTIAAMPPLQKSSSGPRISRRPSTHRINSQTSNFAPTEASTEPPPSQYSDYLHQVPHLSDGNVLTSASALHEEQEGYHEDNFDENRGIYPDEENRGYTIHDAEEAHEPPWDGYNDTYIDEGVELDRSKHSQHSGHRSRHSQRSSGRRRSSSTRERRSYTEQIGEVSIRSNGTSAKSKSSRRSFSFFQRRLSRQSNPTTAQPSYSDDHHGDEMERMLSGQAKKKGTKRKIFNFCVVFTIIVGGAVVLIFWLSGMVFNSDNKNEDIKIDDGQQPPILNDTTTTANNKNDTGWSLDYIIVPEPPSDIIETCSETNTLHIGGMFQCKTACRFAECCYKNTCYYYEFEGEHGGVDIGKNNRENCVLYSPYCDVVFRGRMPPIQEPQDIEEEYVPENVLPTPAKNIKTVCHPLTFDEEKCNDICEVGQCCTLPAQSNDSCYRGNEMTCVQYSPCLSLMNAADIGAGDGDNNEILQAMMIPEEPNETDLELACSPKAMIESQQNVMRCYNLCTPGWCCFSLEYSCFNEENQGICENYAHCKVLSGIDYGGNGDGSSGQGGDNAEVGVALSQSGDSNEHAIMPEPPVDIDIICSYTNLIDEEKMEKCERVCLPFMESCPHADANATNSSSIVIAIDVNGSINQEENERLCNMYHGPCSRLSALPAAPENLSDICPSETSAAASSECENVCAPAKCCFASGTESCFGYHEESCGPYTPCKTVFLPTDDSVDVPPPKIPEPPSNIKQLCSTQNLNSASRSQCEDACLPGSCCYVRDGDGSDVKNCFVENEATCGLYSASCFKLREIKTELEIADDDGDEDDNLIEFNVDRLEGNEGTTGTFVIRIHPEWAPIGAERFKEMTYDNFWDECKIFRVVSGFVAQFGINGDPEVQDFWESKGTLVDDPVEVSNLRGTVSFAQRTANTRTTQVFINLKNNSGLDGGGFSPIGEVVR